MAAVGGNEDPRIGATAGDKRITGPSVDFALAFAAGSTVATSAVPPSVGQQWLAAAAERDFAQCSTQHFAARSPAALAAGAT